MLATNALKGALCRFGEEAETEFKCSQNNNGIIQAQKYLFL